jgi:hypothetical protein
MSLKQFKEAECVLTTQKHCPCVDFVLANGEAGRSRRHGFHIGQLIRYTLEPAEGEDGERSREPTGKLSLAFATADVVIVGWRLERLAEYFRDGELLAVRALPDRYAHLDRSKPYVASVTVRPVGKNSASVPD